MRFGTKVTNPTRSAGTSGYTQCTGCGLYFTHLGIARHWDKCKDPGMQKRRKQIKEQLEELRRQRREQRQ